MADKPKRVFEYKNEQAELVRSTCLVRNFGAGVEDIAVCLRLLLGDPETQRALQVLRDDFLDHNSIGPRRVAEFLQGKPDEETQADVIGFVKALLDRCQDKEK